MSMTALHPKGEPGSYHIIVIIVIQGRRIRYGSLHLPPLRFIFGTNKVLDFPKAHSVMAMPDAPGVFSTYASDGTWPGASFASQYLCRR